MFDLGSVIGGARNAQAFELTQSGLRGGPAAGNDLFRAGEVRGVESLDVGQDHHVAQLGVDVPSLHRAKGHRLRQYVHQGLQAVRRRERLGHVAADDDIGPERSDFGRREVSDDAAVDQIPPLDLDRCEHARDREAGPDRVRQETMVQHDRFTGLRIRRYGSERDREVTEVTNGVHVPRQAGQELRDPLPLHDAAGKTRRPIDDWQSEDGAPLLDLPLDRQVAAVRRIAEHPAPIDLGRHGTQLFGREPGGVQSADHASHAGACDRIYGDSRLFENLEDTDVRESAGRAPAERETDAWPF